MKYNATKKRKTIKYKKNKVRRTRKKNSKKRVTKRKGGRSNYDNKSFVDKAKTRASASMLRFTGRNNPKFETRINNKREIVVEKLDNHMEKYYSDTDISSECTNKSCKCKSKDKRIQHILDALNNNTECARTQKLLKNYKNLNSYDLRQLPKNRIKWNIVSRFPAYYDGYMTSDRIKTYIKYLIENNKIEEKSSDNILNNLNSELYYEYKNNGDLIFTCNKIFKGALAKTYIDKCNDLDKNLKELNKNIRDKKYILYENEYNNHILLLVDKSLFKDRQEINDIELSIPFSEIELPNITEIKSESKTNNNNEDRNSVGSVINGYDSWGLIPEEEEDEEEEEENKLTILI